VTANEDGHVIQQSCFWYLHKLFENLDKTLQHKTHSSFAHNHPKVETSKKSFTGEWTPS
jgi:hypothetical protein